MRMMRHTVAVLVACLAVLAGVRSACAAGSGADAAETTPLLPERTYYGVNRAIPMLVTPPESTRAIPEVHLIDPATNARVERASVARGRIDLASLFPVLWTTREPKLLYAQLVVSGERIGAPVVLQPMLSPPTVRDGLTDALERALRSRDVEQLRALAELGAQERERLRTSVVIEPPARAVTSGIRAYVDQVVVMNTSAGEMRFRMRPDEAPNTVFAFLEFCRGGLYTDVAFHRVIAADGLGRPFVVQAGDPTGTGFGGPGFGMAFERSGLEHGFGVLSMARRPDNPNSNGSQFFVCLSREACAPLDGLYTSFAQMIDGARVLQTIEKTPVGERDPSVTGSARDRPLDPPVIRGIELVPAPPRGSEARPAERLAEDPVVR